MSTDLTGFTQSISGSWIPITIPDGFSPPADFRLSLPSNIPILTEIGGREDASNLLGPLLNNINLPQGENNMTTSLSIFNQSGLGLNLPTGALAYGAYNLIARRRRRSLMNWLLIAYGLYGTGLLGSLTNNQENLQSMAIKTAAFAINPTIGAAAIGGMPMALAALAGAWLSRSQPRRKRSRSYSYSRPRRSYWYRKRRY